MIKKIECRKIYLGLGSNTGNRRKNIIKATCLINRIKGVTVLKSSRIYKSEPWGYKDQKEFYNSVTCIKTGLKPMELLKQCQKIEKKMGKRKRFKWGPRIIDIDILTYKSQKTNSKILTIPHKYIIHRIFTVLPLFEIDKTIRINGQSIDYFAGMLQKAVPVKSRGAFFENMQKTSF